MTVERGTDSPNVKPKCELEVVALLVGKDKNKLSSDAEYKYLKDVYDDLDSAIDKYTTVDDRKNPYQGNIKRIIWK